MKNEMEKELREVFDQTGEYLLQDAADEIHELEAKIAKLMQAGEDLYLAVLESQCCCPTKYPCACSRETAMDKWHGLCRKNKQAASL